MHSSKKLILVFIYIILANILFAQNKISFDSLEKVATFQPKLADKVIVGLLQKNPGNLHYQFIQILAKLNLGKHRIVDSLIDNVIKHNAYETDSNLLIRILEVESKNNKILDQFDKSLARLNQIEDYYIRHNNTIGLLEVTLLFAETYRATGQFDQAIQSLHKAEEIGKRISAGMPIKFKMRLYNRKAAVFLEKAIYLDSVEWLSKEVIKLAKENHDQHQLASSLNELGFLYLNLENPEAEKLLKEAITIWHNLGYSIYENNARMNLSRFYLHTNLPKKAIELSNESLKLVKENGWEWDEETWNNILSSAYSDLHDYKNAYYYSEIAKKQLILNLQNQFNERVAYYTDKLDLKEKEEEIVKKNQEVLLAHHELEVHQVSNRTLLIITIFLAIFLAIITIAYVQINRQRKLVTKQKSEIDLINKELEALLSQKEILLREVNHRVKNNLSLLSGLMYMKQTELESEESVNAMRDMQGRINSISQIHESMIDSENPDSVDFQLYLEKLATQIAQVYNYPGRNSIRFKINCNNFKPELGNAVSLAMIVNELITNSVKYAFKQIEFPEIVIRYDKETDCITYFDNGPGYVPETEKKTLGSRLLKILTQQLHADLFFEKQGAYMVNKIKFNQS